VVSMAGNGSCSKLGRNQSSPRRQCPVKKETLLRGEEGILELISLGVPLPGVLNKLCAAIDLQIGNVVSVILPTEGRELHATTVKALRFGLNVFWSASIPLRDEQALGSFQMYCCVPRSPSSFELQLIERVTHLAALAIRRHKDQDDFETFFSLGSHAPNTSSREWVYLN
jgi:hypothetical protein